MQKSRFLIQPEVNQNPPVVNSQKLLINKQPGIYSRFTPPTNDNHDKVNNHKNNNYNNDDEEDVPQEVNDSQIGTTLQNASFHSQRSEQSFRQNQNNLHKDKNSMVNQNLYSIQPYRKISNRGQILVQQDDQKYKIWYTQQSQSILASNFEEKKTENTVEQKKVNQTVLNSTQNDSDILEEAMILVPFLQDQAQQIHKLEDDQNRCKTQITQLALKINLAEKIIIYLDNEWPSLVQKISDNQVNHAKFLNKIVDLDAGLIEFTKETCLKITQESENQCKQGFELLRRMNKAYNLCICKKILSQEIMINPVSLDIKTMLQDISKMNKLIKNKYLDDKGNVIIEQFQEIDKFLEKISDRMYDCLKSFTQYLNCVRLSLNQQNQAMVQITLSFSNQCQQPEKQHLFTLKCEKILQILQEGMNQIKALKLPMSQEQNNSFNNQRFSNAKIILKKAQFRLQKYFEFNVQTFPLDIRQDIMDDAIRIELINTLKIQTKTSQKSDHNSIIQLLSQPMMLVPRLELFTLDKELRSKYLIHINNFKKIIEAFLTIPQLEADVHSLQGSRKHLQQLAQRTENNDVIKTLLKEVQTVKGKLEQIQNQVKSNKWNMMGSQSCVPLQIQCLIQWIETELQSVNNLEQIHLQHLQENTEDKQLLSGNRKTLELIERLQNVIKYEPTITQILSGSIQGTKEYNDVLNFIYQGTIEPEIHQLPLQLEVDLDSHFEYLLKHKNTIHYATQLKQEFIQQYNNLSDTYIQYIIWQNIQGCRFIMDGEIISEIIRSTSIFPTVGSKKVLTLNQTQELMMKLIRAFVLNIKNSEHCVFFKMYVQEGLKMISIILSHFNKMKEFLKLDYQEKKSINLTQMNNNVKRQFNLLFVDQDSSLQIIREPLVTALGCYLEDNLVLFSTKGATLEWDWQIVETTNFILEVDVQLKTASQYLEKIIRSSLFEQCEALVQLPFEEFCLNVPQLVVVEEQRVKLTVIKVQFENLISNKIDVEEYRNKYIYILSVISELLFWIKGIDKVSKVAFLTNGRINDILQFDEVLSPDYLRQLRIFHEELQLATSEIKLIEMRSPLQSKNNDRLIPPDDINIKLTCAFTIDNQVLLTHKISKTTVYLVDILKQNVFCLLNIQKLISQEIKIDEQFFDLLNRYVVYYEGAALISLRKKIDLLAEPLFVSSDGSTNFNKSIINIPSYCAYPQKCIKKCMISYEPLMSIYGDQLQNLQLMNKINQTTQIYYGDKDKPLVSLALFVEDHQQILQICGQNQYQEQLDYANLCLKNIVVIDEFCGFIIKIITLAISTQVKQQKCLNKFKDEGMWRQFLEKEKEDWKDYLKLVHKTVKDHQQSLDEGKNQDLDIKPFKQNIMTLTNKSKQLANKEHCDLLITLYQVFIKVFDPEFEQNNI